MDRGNPWAGTDNALCLLVLKWKSWFVSGINCSVVLFDEAGDRKSDDPSRPLPLPKPTAPPPLTLLPPHPPPLQGWSVVVDPHSKIDGEH